MSEGIENKYKSVDYQGFILGLSSAALSYLGVTDDDTQSDSKNLVLARQNIDIIAMLKDKTKGNLTDEEQKLTDEVLADLRMRFVEALKSSQS